MTAVGPPLPRRAIVSMARCLVPICSLSLSLFSVFLSLFLKQIWKKRFFFSLGAGGGWSGHFMTNRHGQWLAFGRALNCVNTEENLKKNKTKQKTKSNENRRTTRKIPRKNKRNRNGKELRLLLRPLPVILLFSTEFFFLNVFSLLSSMAIGSPRTSGKKKQTKKKRSRFRFSSISAIHRSRKVKRKKDRLKERKKEKNPKNKKNAHWMLIRAVASHLALARWAVSWQTSF